MKIVDVRSFRLRGPPPVGEGFWEERLVRPIDIYTKYREEMNLTTGTESPFEQTFLGGPTRDEIPAYASMLGCSLKPDDVVKRCQEYVDRGFTAIKWFSAMVLEAVSLG